MKKTNITITRDALLYLKTYLETDNDTNTNIYISVIYPFTKDAHVNITYCKKSDLNLEDIELNFDNIIIYIEKKSTTLLNHSIIDIKNTTLFINAPNLHINTDKNIKNINDQIKQLIENEINVILSQHGGFIELIDIINNEKLIVKFHGGCQGCGMIGHTLNNYIEKIIKKHFPNIKSIDDVTQHEIKNNSYY